MIYLALVLVLVGATLVFSLIWRAVSRRRSAPCPAWLAWMLERPFSKRPSSVLSRLELSAGLRVLDAGCGAGRLSIPIAQIIGPRGAVLAVDIQPKMLALARSRAGAAGVSNIDFLLAGLGEGKLPASSFDRALLVTVLGEIPDRLAALREICSALRPGGFLLVKEIVGDPHYQSTRTVTGLAEQAGFLASTRYGNWLSFSMKLEKPADAKAVSDLTR